ncbi:MAG: HD-GYP domain-containing protein [Candidatus Omnitrophica bacterium]|nr:HD-GYP domain-containing protein [Candidatus Omnitrophota bacterium]
MSKSNQSPNKSNGASHGFKITMVILLFAVTLLRLTLISYFPGTEIISDKIILVVILIIVAYLWIQEVRDYQRLLALNEDLRISHEQLKQAEIDTITALIKAEEEKDEYTRGHSERVTKIAFAIAEEMGFSEERKRVVERAGILHDIGKIGISDMILNKKEKLTDEEWEIIKSHPGKAEEILKPLKFLAAEREIMLSHHERYDGKGYPKGLNSRQIKEEALILAVADAFDAMNSARSYRQPLSKEAIMSELERSRGTQHSAEVVDSLLKVLKKRPELWERR